MKKKSFKKVNSRSQATAKDILSKAWKLAKIDIRKYMTEEERASFNVLIKEVNEKTR